MGDTIKMQAGQVEIVRNEAFVRKAEALKPALLEEAVKAARVVEVVADAEAMHGWRAREAAPAEALEAREFKKGDAVVLDFGDHRVGYVSFDVRPVGSPPDAPLKLKLTFGEMPVEMAEPFSSYNGWISSSWLQEEILLVDVLPARISLPRRYSFRYLKLEVLDTSQKYRVAFEGVTVRTVTSGDVSAVAELAHPDPVIREIDRVSVKTLQDCMQDVFEDGPKRDRRLWLGDLRLQALANYETFRGDDLVKRCLYLFAAVPDELGRVTANLFIEPDLIADDTYLYDYSLFFAATLHDYVEATGDEETLRELWPLARRQVELGLERLDETGVLRDEETWWAFIDWHQSLNKQAPAQGVLIYTLKRAIAMAERVGCDSATGLAARLAEVEAATLARLWDAELGFFVSGADRQVSWASQAWLALAEVLPPEDNRALMLRLLAESPDIGPTTPYMYHHVVEALLLTGCRDQAVAMLKQYWGGMLEDGADTFWELYDPQDKSFSPYGSHLINSYCHAWSCTPTYLIRKFGL
ncbi:alpha-L-rhamnosidase [Cohnella sp. OV330]|uniref:alpha-L-rhamnosidase-related protein n=1 Tax=Cohnella sp. OV330 TaxID=1855288 RepID=UPI0008ECCBA6|nr:family 78 glycoside hydrolase catalytic domain [Cohnella sp. OV330]SFB05918.1 alpha-L-rhamnosidase [Cohnella sp. OV330]